MTRRASPGRTLGRSGTVLHGASRLGAASVAAALAFVLLATACTTPVPTGQPSPNASPTGETVTVRAYFFLGSFGAANGLVPVERTVPRLESATATATATAQAAIEALFAGPNAAELGGRPAMYTNISDGTTLLGLDIEGGVAIVDLPLGVHSGGNATTIEAKVARIRGRLAQIVFTLTQFPAITDVLFKTEGSAQDVIDANGELIFRPLTRSDYSDLLPAVFVDSPVWGGTLSNPARITGLANAFEATFHVRILGADGRSLADGPVMATCGTGCWGTFDVSVPYVVSSTAPGTMQVYELSAMDGSIINLTEYPVTLTP